MEFLVLQKAISHLQSINEWFGDFGILDERKIIEYTESTINVYSLSHMNCESYRKWDGGVRIYGIAGVPNNYP